MFTIFAEGECLEPNTHTALQVCRPSPGRLSFGQAVADDSTYKASPGIKTEWLIIIFGSLLLTLILYFTSPSLWESMDYVFFYRPNFQFLHDAIWSGTVPLWNPHIGLGRPFLGDTQNAVFYPPLWLVLLGPHIALVLLAWMHHILAFVGMRKLAELSGAEKLPANLAAVAFILGGPFVSRWASGQIMYCCALAYMPWLFILARRTFETFEWRRIALTALILALQFFCGHPQIFWVTGIGMGLYILGRGLFPLGKQSAFETLKALGQLALASLWSFAIVACVLLPFIDLIGQGNRPDSVEFASFGKMPTEAFLSLFGTLKPLWEYNIFIGWWLALPGLAGLTLIRNRECRAWLFVIVISAVMALGDGTPMFELNYHLLPGFAKMRFVARIAVLIPFGLAITAAIWLSNSEHPRKSMIRLAAVSAGALVLVFTLYKAPVNPWQLSRSVNLLGFALPALLAAAAFVRWNSPKARNTILAIITVGCVIELGSEAWSNKAIYGMRNISGIDPAHPGQALLVEHLRQHHPTAPDKAPARVLLNSHAVPESYGMIHDYSSPDAYTSLFLKRPWDYLHAMLGITSPSLANTYLHYDVYKTNAFPWPAIAQDVGFDTEKGLVNNPAPTPRAFLVFAAQPPMNATNILSLLTNGHDIYQSALIETPLPHSLPGKGPPAEPVPFQRFQDNEIEFQISTEQNALLVLAEVWYPGWQAEVNGEIVATQAANYWMRAVSLPAGESKVRIFYRERKLPAGIALSLISILAAGFVLRRPKVTSPHREPSPQVDHS